MLNKIFHLQKQLAELQKKVLYLEKYSSDNLIKQETTTLITENNEILSQAIPSEKQDEKLDTSQLSPVTNNSTAEAVTQPKLVNPTIAEQIGTERVTNLPFEKAKSNHSKQSDVGERFISWLIKGNPVAKVAIIILFFGLSYLFKYSIEHGLLSPEIRILGAVALGITLLTIGWHLRRKKELYALILQGGAIGILYLTIFAAFKLYMLIPVLLTFALLVVISSASILFAILQRAMSLAVIASIGGYLAPILISTNEGNHIGLFSYYLLISSTILIISIWQSWRILNLLGFIFTFIVALVWGMKSFRPEFYNECQIFILANMLIYGVLAVLLSIRSIKKEHYQYPIDLILLFGVPLSGFALQYSITSQWEFGPAFSSLGFGLFYLVGAYITLRAWHSTAKNTSLLGLAIGLGFSTLAIPLAFTANLTALIWLFEGTALSWAMLTQKQYRFAWFGTFITLLGTCSALVAWQLSGLTIIQFISLFGLMSALLLFSACLWHHYRSIHTSANSIKLLFFVIASITWIIWILNSIIRATETLPSTQPIILAFIASVWLWYFIGRKISWDLICYAVISLWPVLFLSQVSNNIFNYYSIDIRLWSLIWPVAFVSAYFYLYTAKSLIIKLHNNLFILLHISLFWLTLSWSFREVIWLFNLLPWGFSVVKWSLITTIASATILLFYLLTKRQTIVSQTLLRPYWLIGLLPIGLYLTFYLLIALTSSGQIIYWRYIPLINPLEESAIFAWIMLGVWLKFIASYLGQHNKLINIKSFSTPLPNLVLIPLVVLAFLWSNSMVMRLLSQNLAISWSFYALWHTNIVQVVLSLIWMLTAVILVTIAHRYSLRKVWYAGAILQGIVVAKLAFVDSVELDGLLRAFVFIGVALLMLVIGYLAPLPPKLNHDVV